MKRFLIFAISVCVWTFSLYAQNGEFDPVNPGDPMPYYTLYVEVNPAAGGEANISRTMVAEGTNVELYINPAIHFAFQQWVCGDSVLSDQTSFSFTMPARNVVITAQLIYDTDAFNPPSPEDPQGNGVILPMHRVTVYTSPSIGGSANQTAFNMEEGTQEQIYAYPNAGYEFTGWMKDGQLFSTRNPLHVQMDKEDLTYTATFAFNPTAPADPNANFFDAAEGILLIDRFTTGRLYNAVSQVLGNVNLSDVRSLIVIGQLSIEDLGIIQSLKNCQTIDLCRSTGLTEIPSWLFAEMPQLTAVLLPSTVETIGDNAFYNCPKLQELTLYSTAPPQAGAETFVTLKPTLIIRVPASSFDLYKSHTIYSYFSLSALDSQSLTVNLPNDAQDGRYTNMSLQVTDNATGQTWRYIISDRTTYTFNNLFRNSRYTITVKNNKGTLLGQLEDVAIGEKDETVTFTSLLQPLPLQVQVLNENGEDVTSDVKIHWKDTNGSIIHTGALITGQIEKTELYYSVILRDNLLNVYETPQRHKVIVSKDNQHITCRLQKTSTVVISGIVISATTRSPIEGIYVSLTQLINGKSANVQFAETDKNGQFSIEVLKAQTTIYLTDHNYLKHTILLDTAQLGDIGTVQMQPLIGTTLFVRPQFIACAPQGEKPDTSDYYTDYANIDFTVYNITQQKTMQTDVKYPVITLPEKIELGDSLTITASSRNHKFNATQAGVKIDSTLYAQVLLPIIQLGSVSASYQQADAEEVVALLYNEKGELLKRKMFDNEHSVSFDYINDGNYTLVCIENIKPFSSISRETELASSGLKEGTDYLKRSVTIHSGEISMAEFDNVKAIDITEVYTGDNMRFTSTATQVMVGNYITLKALIDINREYREQASDVRLVFDMPENTEFVEGSVMVGRYVNDNYTYENGRLVIPVSNTNQQIAFCVIPLKEGNYSPCAYTLFKVGSSDVQIPVASTYYEVKGITLNVPQVFASRTITASGTAIPNSMVEVYADDELIGSAQALGTGNWSADCTFRNLTNLKTMKVHAEATDKNGDKHLSETKDCQYNQDAIKVSKVTMYHWNPEVNNWKGITYEIVFDFQNPSRNPGTYVYYIYNREFTFDIDFTSNDTTLISNVVLYVKTGDGTWTELQSEYSNEKGKWIAKGEFGNMYDGNIPVNVAVDFALNFTSAKADRNNFDSNIDGVYNFIDEDIESHKNILNEFNNIKIEEYNFTILDSLLNNDTASIDSISKIIGQIIPDSITFTDYDTTMFSSDLQFIEEFLSSIEKWNNDSLNYYVQSALDYTYCDTTFSKIINTQYLDTDNPQRYAALYELNSIDIDSLEAMGYIKFEMTDESEIYILYGNTEISLIDTKSKLKYTTAYPSIPSNVSQNSFDRHAPMLLPSSYYTCAKAVIQEGTTLLSLVKGEKITKDNLIPIKDAISTILSVASCYYEGLRFDLVGQITDFRNKRIAKLTNELESTTNVLTIAQKSLKESERAARDCQSSYLYWYDQKKKLYTNTELTDVERAAELKKIEKNIGIYLDAKKSAQNRIKELNKAIKVLTKNKQRLEKSITIVTDALKKAVETIKKMPPKISPVRSLPNMIKIGGKLAGPVGCLINLWTLYCDGTEALKDINEWEDLMNQMEKNYPFYDCREEEAKKLSRDIEKSACSHIYAHVSTFAAEAAATQISVASTNIYTWSIEQILWGTAEITKAVNFTNSIKSRGNFYVKMTQLWCEDDKPKDKPKGKESPSPDAKHTIDPAGFVYEAVSDNRVEGVTATIYYKDSVRNEFGEVTETDIMWNAEEYEQENPLYTDENGEYQWFVPRGLWQVRFEKEGYESTQSEWLPVPPPQLEVNIPIVQLRQPKVIQAVAYKNTIDITFDKYMIPEYLTSSNILVSSDNQMIEGTITLLNAQTSYGEDTTTYVSKVRFIPAEDFTAPQITLTVSSRVRSYADIQMAETFQQTFDIADAMNIEKAQIPTSSLPDESTVDIYTELILSCGTEGAVIRYTLDGTIPDCQTGLAYSRPIVLNRKGITTITAIACAEGYDPSDVVQWQYRIVEGTALTEEEVTLPKAIKRLDKGVLYIIMPNGKVYNAQGMPIIEQ